MRPDDSLKACIRQPGFAGLLAFAALALLAMRAEGQQAAPIPAPPPVASSSLSGTQNTAAKPGPIRQALRSGLEKVPHPGILARWRARRNGQAEGTSGIGGRLMGRLRGAQPAGQTPSGVVAPPTPVPQRPAAGGF